MKGVRTFIGIFPPPETLSRIANIQSPLAAHSSPVRWERQEKLHITMKFLGNISAQQLHDLETALSMETSKMRQFDITLTRLAFFPSNISPKIVWIGSLKEENILLSQCFSIIDRACSSAGFKTEERPFHPHITLGRVKGKISGSLIKTIENTTFEPLKFLCTELLIMKSDLSPSGSAYSQQSRIPLNQ